MDDLSHIYKNEKDPSGNLLEPQEKLILEQIAAGEPPHSQRAHSLLAIDAGVTHKIAALHSGQTVGQVSYWLGKFRRDRLGIFPEELLSQTGSAPIPLEQLTDQPAPEAKLEKKEKTKNKSKKGKTKKKSKKDKASKKKQKGKKTKKSKKEKKNKKKKDKKK